MLSRVLLFKVDGSQSVKVFILTGYSIDCDPLHSQPICFLLGLTGLVLILPSPIRFVSIKINRTFSQIRLIWVVVSQEKLKNEHEQSLNKGSLLSVWSVFIISFPMAIFSCLPTQVCESLPPPKLFPVSLTTESLRAIVCSVSLQRACTTFRLGGEKKHKLFL